MDPAGGGGAVTVPTIVAANRTSSNVIINGNHQSNSHPQHQQHTLIHSNNSSSSNNSNNSLIISGNGGGGSSNSSSSSSSTSSNSSGYGSTSATPTNSYETHTAATTPVAIAEPIIPVATVAAVSPFYSEAITAQALESQHYSQQHQPLLSQHQHLQQQPQQHLHAHQQQQHQQLQQNLQDTQRQQYYSSYDYTQQQPLQHHQQLSQPHQQQQHANNLSSTYNMGSGSPAFDGASATSSSGIAYQQGVAHPYKASAATAGVAPINYERQLSGRSASSSSSSSSPAGSTTAANFQQHLPNEATTPKPITLSQHHQQFLGVSGSSSKARSSNSLLGPSSSSSSSTGTKPQAAATPFYAQPLSQQQQPSNTSSFYDQLKHKMPLDYHDNFANFPNAAAYHQQQKYYAAAKSQLKEAATYGSPPGLTGKSLYHNTNNFYAGTTAQHAASLPTTGYDKYMYHSAYPSLGYETTPETAYRKASTASSLNSSSWPWGIDYAAGNSRTIPPPTGHLPTATVAPTHASYLAANTSHLARDPYYMAHEKFGMKYDKYPPPYQQAYVSPPATRHHLWPGTHAPLNERLAPPPPHALHTTSPYFPSNTPTAINARQSCCAQPYQAQSCYYPPGRLTHGQASGQASSAYMAPQPTAHHQPHLSPLNSSCKYGTVMDYGTGTKLKNPNDLYISSHYDANNPAPQPPAHLTHPHNYQYGSAAAAAAAAANNQLYSSNQMHHGQQPARSLIAHDPMANAATYSNDLSLPANTYDTYLHEPPSHMNHPQTLGISSGPTTAAGTAYAPTAAKRALLDYRKPIQPQPPPLPPVPEETYAQQTLSPGAAGASRERYHQSPELLNTPETTTTFNEYDTQSQASGYTPEENAGALQEIASKPGGEEVTKNLSLRDFIANWNDDEDDYAAASSAENLSFDQSTVINEVLKASTAEPQHVMELSPPPLISDKVRVTESACKVAPTVKQFEDSSLSEVDANQYVNLPDIIIDIEKSNVNSSITTPPNSEQAVYSNSLTLEDFDVEKELDQLQQMRKGESESVIVKPSPRDDTDKTNETKTDIKPNNVEDTTPRKSEQQQDQHAKSLTTQISFDDLNLEPNKIVLPSRPLTAASTTTDSANAQTHSEQYFKEIEAYDSGNSHHSNESSLFEKEYETFINKITTSSESTNKRESESNTDFEQNVQDFSKFYKRKRKLKDEEIKSPQKSLEQHKKKLKSAEEESINKSNFPQVYTKKSRNKRRLALVKRLKPDTMRRRKPSSFYYKLMHTLRRYRLRRSKRVRDYIAELKEKHLPLIKRQSIKNYSIGMSATTNRFSPLSLKTLVLMVINSEEFRERIMVVQLEESPETEDKHICVDPSCETCEVIRSLMEPETYEDTVLEETQAFNNEILEISSVAAEQISAVAVEPTIIVSSSSSKNVLTEAIEDSPAILTNTFVLAEGGESEILLKPNIEAKDLVDQMLPSDPESQIEYEEPNLKTVEPKEGVIIKTRNIIPGKDLSDSQDRSKISQFRQSTDQISTENGNQTISREETQLFTERPPLAQTKEAHNRPNSPKKDLIKTPDSLRETAAVIPTVIRKHATERDDDFEPKRKCSEPDDQQPALRKDADPAEEISNDLDSGLSKNLPDTVQPTTVIQKLIGKSKEIWDDSEEQGYKEHCPITDVVQGYLATEDIQENKVVNNGPTPENERELVPIPQNVVDTSAALQFDKSSHCGNSNNLSGTATNSDEIAQTTTVIRKHESKPKDVHNEVSNPLSIESKAKPNEIEEDDDSESDTDSSSCSSCDSSDDEDKECEDSEESNESDSEIETRKILIKEVEICEQIARGSIEANECDRVSEASGDSPKGVAEKKTSSDFERKDSSVSESAKEISRNLVTYNENEKEFKAYERKEEKIQNFNIQNISRKEESKNIEDEVENIAKNAVGIKQCLTKLVKSNAPSSSDLSDESEDELSDFEQRDIKRKKKTSDIIVELDTETPNKKSKLSEEPRTPIFSAPTTLSAEKIQDLSDRPKNKEYCPAEKISVNADEIPETHSIVSNTSEGHASPNEADQFEAYLTSDYNHSIQTTDLDKLFPHSPIKILSDDEDIDKLSLESSANNVTYKEDTEKLSPVKNKPENEQLDEFNPTRKENDIVIMDMLFPHSPTKNVPNDKDFEKRTPKSPENIVLTYEHFDKTCPESPAKHLTENEDIEKLSLSNPVNGVSQVSNESISLRKCKNQIHGNITKSSDDDRPVPPPDTLTSFHKTKETHAEVKRKGDIIDLSEETSSSEDSEEDDSDNESLDFHKNYVAPYKSGSMQEVAQVVDITEDSTSEEDSDFDEADDNENSSKLYSSQTSKNLKKCAEESSYSVETNSNDSEDSIEDEDKTELISQNQIKRVPVESNKENQGLDTDSIQISDEKQRSIAHDKEDSRYSSEKGHKTSVITSIDAPQPKNQSALSPRLHSETPIQNDEENSVLSSESGFEPNISDSTTKTPNQCPVKAVQTPQEEGRRSLIYSSSVEEDTTVSQKESIPKEFLRRDCAEPVIGSDEKGLIDFIMDVEINKTVSCLEGHTVVPQKATEYNSAPDEDKIALSMADAEESKEESINIKIQVDKTREESKTPNNKELKIFECCNSLVSQQQPNMISNATNIKENTDISIEGTNKLFTGISEESITSEDSKSQSSNQDHMPQARENSSKDDHEDQREEDNFYKSNETSITCKAQTPNNLKNTEANPALLKDNHLKSVQSDRNDFVELKCSSPKFLECVRDDFANEILDLSKDSKISKNTVGDNPIITEELETLEAERKESTSLSPVNKISPQIMVACESTDAPYTLQIACQKSALILENEIQTTQEALKAYNVKKESNSLNSPATKEPTEIEAKVSDTLKKPYEPVEETASQEALKTLNAEIESNSLHSPASKEPTRIEDETYIAKVSDTLKKSNESAEETASQSLAIEESTELVDKEPQVSETNMKVLKAPSTRSPIIEELTHPEDEDNTSRVSDTPKQPFKSMKTTSPQPALIEERSKTDNEPLMSIVSKSLKECNESLKATSKDQTQIDNGESSQQVSETFTESNETHKESYESLKPTSTKSPNIEDQIDDVKSPLELSDTPLESNEYLDDASLTRETINDESITKVSNLYMEPLRAFSPQSPTNEEPTIIKAIDTLLNVSELSKELYECFEKTSTQFLVHKELTEIDDDKSMPKTADIQTESYESSKTNSPQIPSTKDEPLMKDEESLLNVSEPSREPCESFETSSSQSPVHEESIEMVPEVSQELDECLETTSTQFTEHKDLSDIDDDKSMPKMTEIQTESNESLKKKSPQTPPTKEEPRMKDEESMLNVSEPSKEPNGSLGTSSSQSPLQEESIDMNDGKSMPKVSKIFTEPYESLNACSPKSMIFEEPTLIKDEDSLQTICKSSKEPEESLEKTLTLSPALVESAKINDGESIAPTKPYESLEENVKHSPALLECNDLNYPKAQNPTVTQTSVCSDTRGHPATLEQLPIPDPKEEDGDSSSTDKFQSSHLSDETSKDFCHYSDSSKSSSSSEAEASENCISCEVSHPLTRTLYREASPEMNFWNTKGKYHTLRNYKTLSSKYCKNLRTEESRSGPQSTSGRLEGVKTPDSLNYTPRCESAMSGDFRLDDSLTVQPKPHDTKKVLSMLSNINLDSQTTATALEDTISLQNSKVRSPLDNSKMSSPSTLDKTTEEVSNDYFGFKNQSSFDDASEDFHGFEDQHEEDRIRREIESLNEDSAANDAFPYAATSAVGQFPARSTNSMSPELDELEALEKELCQHHLVKGLSDSAVALNENDEEELETEPHLVSVSNVIISTNDIEHIKKMLESDEEPATDEPETVMKAKDKEKKSDGVLSKNVKEIIGVTNSCLIPKLSDLCRAALNSSLNVNNLTTVQSNEDKVDEEKETTTTNTPLGETSNTVSQETCSTPSIVVERELSVEEALAEMYRQAGVLLSDPEDNDNDRTITTVATTNTTSRNEEAQDVLLINLHEILNSDNDVYVLQCDMNVNEGDADANDAAAQHFSNNANGDGTDNATITAERVNTLQLIGILNTDRENSEIHIISSDSESEVIILSDCDTDVEFQAPAPPPRSASKRTTPPRDYIPFINDLDTSDDSMSDLSTIHHEEIVPDNLHKFLQDEFYKYLHEKYAQKKLSKYYHANRVLRKYKKKVSNKFRQ